MVVPTLIKSPNYTLNLEILLKIIERFFNVCKNLVRISFHVNYFSTDQIKLIRNSRFFFHYTICRYIILQYVLYFSPPIRAYDKNQPLEANEFSYIIVVNQLE